MLELIRYGGIVFRELRNYPPSGNCLNSRMISTRHRRPLGQGTLALWGVALLATPVLALMTALCCSTPLHALMHRSADAKPACHAAPADVCTMPDVPSPDDTDAIPPSPGGTSSQFTSQPVVLATVPALPISPLTLRWLQPDDPLPSDPSPRRLSIFRI